jgi:hypothetical protein
MNNARLKTEIQAELDGLQSKMRALEERLSLIEEEREDEAEGITVRATRTPMHTGIEFIGDFDLLEAEGVDISETGICFELHNPLPFDMQFMQNDELVCRRARLIWVKQLENERSRLGLRFVDPDDPASVIKKVPGA